MTPFARTQGTPILTFGNLTTHNASFPVSVLGCIEEHEICNPASTPEEPVCVTYRRHADYNDPDFSQWDPLDLSETQRATLMRLERIRAGAGLALTSDTLLASSSSVIGVQFAEFLNTQWQLEVSR